MPIPILVYTDAPSHNTGLARICRELCAHIHENLRDVYRVATLGVFGRGSAKYPWPQYSANGPEDALFNLRQVTEDFFDNERGIVFSITPPSWLFQLCLSEFMVKERAEWKAYSDWMSTRPFEKWAYLAIESHGPFNQYGPTTSAILRSLDRRLYYSRWGTDIAKNSGIAEPDGYWRYCGHGVDTSTWKAADPDLVRKSRTDLGVSPNDVLLGCVATNTRRKQLPLFFEAAYMLRRQIGSSRLKLWINTDVAIREYNLSELAECYGFRPGTDFLMTSNNAKRSDEWLALMYSSCDITTLPTGGEGFGYPVIESLACGTPCVTGTFGAQSEFLQGFRESWLCPPLATHIITNNTLLEPIYDPQQYASRLLMAWTELRQRGTLLREDCRQRAEMWSWANIWPHWEQWFLMGAAELQLKIAKQKEADPDAKYDSVCLPPETGQVGGMGSNLRGDSDQQGQPADLRDDGRLDSGAPIGVDREADAAGAR